MMELYQIECMDVSKATMNELREARVRLSKANWKEYTTRGNTPRCGELFRKLEEVDREIDMRLN